MRTIAIHGDTHLSFDLRTPAGTTGQLAAPTPALTTVKTYYSATAAGADIGGTETALAEYSAKAGRYFGVLDESLKSAWTVGGYIYEILTVDGEIQSSERLKIILANPAQ